MDTQQALRWPDEPYRELDFYTAADEALFCDRSTEVEECMQLFLQYHTKVLLLHGSSGSGKSSFLRAGLIPHLKRVADPPGFAFLPEQDGVIRCSDDPVRVIAGQVLAAAETAGNDTVRQSRPVRELRESAPLLSSENLASASSPSLLEPLLNSLSLLRLMVGKTVVLVVDQAEEILTHPRCIECTDTFFRFIEEIYLRDFDVRLIISLRTEYYGRFRNHLQIRDRYRALPADGGLELYLLTSLRDPALLTHALNRPACSGQHNYGFRFAPGALRTIVEDVLGILPANASVTPALQVICATLTRQRNPDNPITVTAEHYRALGGLRRILDRFIDSAVTKVAAQKMRPFRSVRAAIGISDSLTDRWRSVLVTMVSDQGGGVVVAIPRSQADLERAAQSHGLTDRLAPALRSMAHGRGAILRLMGTETEPAYILKHDSLALRLARWNEQQVGVRRFRRKVIYAGCAGLAICMVAAGALLASSFSSLSVYNAGIRLRNNFAEHEPGGRADRSLMVILANVTETREHYNLADRLHRSPVHQVSVSALRRTLLRVPWFHGRFAAAGMSSDGTRLAMLNTDRDKLHVLTFPDGVVDEVPWDHLGLYRIGSGAPAELPPRREFLFPPVVGFVAGLGPVVVRDNQAYAWLNERVVSRSLEPMLPKFEDRAPLRFEITGGAIQATHRRQREVGAMGHTIRLDRAALEREEPIAPAPSFIYPGQPFQPGPLFDNMTSIGRYVRYEETSEPPENDLPLPRDPIDNWSEPPGQGESRTLVISVQKVNEQIIRFPAIQVGKAQEASRPRLAMAFAAGDENAIGFKTSGPSFFLRDWSSAPSTVGLPDGRPRRVSATGNPVGSDQDNRLIPAQWPSINPLFAVARTQHGWRAAWIVGNGIQAVETDPDFDNDSLHDGKAHEILSDVLISEPTGVRLAFSRDGRFLVLEQNVSDWRMVDVKIWDLGSAWQSMINAETTDETKLTRIACRAIREAGAPRTDPLDLLELFDTPVRFANPCAGVP